MNLKQSLILLCISLILSYFIIFLFNQGKEWLAIIPLYFYLLSFASFKFLKMRHKKTPTLFISSYLAVTMIRLFLHLTAIVVLFIYTKEKYLIATLFFVNYIIYTVYEVFKWTSKNENKLI